MDTDNRQIKLIKTKKAFKSRDCGALLMRNDCQFSNTADCGIETLLIKIAALVQFITVMLTIGLSVEAADYYEDVDVMNFGHSVYQRIN
jgi:hypothetical protein